MNIVNYIFNYGLRTSLTQYWNGEVNIWEKINVNIVRTHTPIQVS
jgi:hypothetical protein